MTLPIHGLDSLRAGAVSTPSQDIDPKTLKAAREFESIFLRTLLHSLEKTTSINGGEKLNTGQSTYGSMVVGALSDSISGSGGIGLAEIVARSLSAHGHATGGPPKPLK